MSLTVFKNGLLDTVQDSGRYGFQHLGINPGGAMDRFSASLANSLLGKPEQDPVIEMHFPAATIIFDKPAIICITGGDFSPAVDDTSLPLNQPVMINQNSKLAFKKWKQGARCYLAVRAHLHVEKWLDSYSTNLKAGAGGWHGRSLQTGDTINYSNNTQRLHFEVNAFTKLPWKVNLKAKTTSQISFIKGTEWDWLTKDAKNKFKTGTFLISKSSDRMGFHLEGESLAVHSTIQMVSAGVCFGTVQLLPSGQLLILMADHQTTGGYPKVAYVISAHLPLLAQMRPGEAFTFTETDITTAEHKWLEQQKYLQQIRNASNFKF